MGDHAPEPWDAALPSQQRAYQCAAALKGIPNPSAVPDVIAAAQVVASILADRKLPSHEQWAILQTALDELEETE